MEANGILSAFVVASNQYASSQTEQNLLHLQRHLDVVLGFCSPDHEFLNEPNHMVTTDFFTCLINIVLDVDIKPSLIQRVLSIFQNLARNAVVRQSLQDSFHLYSALSIFLQNYGMPIKDPLAMQSLLLLETFTSGITISYIEGNMENLIGILIGQIDNKFPEVIVPVLHVLSNLCRHNSLVQTHICSLPNMKEIYKLLVSKLRCPTPAVVIYTISILASLSLKSDIGDKLFDSRQIVKTFKLIVHLLVTNCPKTKNAALELFFDIMEQVKFRSHIVKLPELTTIFKKIAEICSNEYSSNQVSGYLKFLLTFIENPESKENALSVLCTAFDHKDNGGASNDAAIHSVLLRWSVETVSSSGDAPIFSLRIIKHIIEAFPDSQLFHIVACIKEILQMIFSKINLSLDLNSGILKKNLEHQVILFDILFILSEKEMFLDFISNLLNIDQWAGIINSQFDYNPLSYKDNLWSEAGVDLLLLTIGIVTAVRDNLPGSQEFLISLLQESRLMPFLAFALSSTCPKRIRNALHAISMSMNLVEFPMQILGESIAATNNSRHQQKPYALENLEFNSNGDPFQNEQQPLLKLRRPYNRRNSIDRNVQSLIQKIENGLDLRELKSSEIMDMYEHKIAALSMKEQELQDFVQAKSAALQQADRVLSQYKCRHAQREAEALKLRCLLKESECRSEAAVQQLKMAVQKQLQLQSELEKTKHEITSLEQLNEEQKEAMTEQDQKLSAVQKNLENLQVEHHSILEMHSMLQRHSETMKQKHDLMAQQILSLEDEKNNTIKQLKEKDTKLKELTKQLQKSEELLKKKEECYQELDAAKECIQKAAEKTEKSKARLEQEMSSLEMVCRQHESSLNEKDARIKSLMDELDRQTQLTDVIHEITSGKLKSNLSSLLNKS